MKVATKEDKKSIKKISKAEPASGACTNRVTDRGKPQIINTDTKINNDLMKLKKRNMRCRRKMDR